MSNSKTDNLLALKLFPNPAEAFFFRVKTTNELKEDGLFVLDANVLLVPYSMGKESLALIKATLSDLAKNGRLLIPGQAAREFIKNRPLKISEVHQQLKRKCDSLSNYQKGTYPLLEGVSLHGEVQKLEKELDKKQRQYRDDLQKLVNIIRIWDNDDPVSTMYREIFALESVFEPALDYDELQADLEYRITNSVPPGYKDSGKLDSGIGDLIIWKTILGVGKSRNVDVVFVTNETKADWWHRSEGTPLMPRIELIEEFRRNTDGRSFNMISFSGLFDLLGVEEKLLEEIRAQEEQDEQAYLLRVVGRIYSDLTTQLLEIASLHSIPFDDSPASELAMDILASNIAPGIDFITISNVLRFCETSQERGDVRKKSLQWLEKSHKWISRVLESLIERTEKRSSSGASTLEDEMTPIGSLGVVSSRVPHHPEYNPENGNSNQTRTSGP